MKAYKVRHKDSGLYYKPGKTNLDEKGKLYPSKNTVLAQCQSSGTVAVTIAKSSRIYKKRPDVFSGWGEDRYNKTYIVAYLPVDSFELIELDLNL